MRDSDAGQLAAEHLIGLGHLALGHLAGPLEFDTTRRRHDGFIAAAALGGATVVVEAVELDEQAGYDGMRRLLERQADVPTAVFVANVSQTIGALAALRAHGVRVPDDLSIVCHDDDIVLEYIDPRVTAIQMPLFRLGSAAIDALVARIEGGPAQDVIVDETPTLVDRASTARLQ
jgi:LacI family transcriptional regulator